MSKQKVAVLMLIVFIMIPFQYMRMKWFIKQSHQLTPETSGLKFTTQK